MNTGTFLTKYPPASMKVMTVTDAKVVARFKSINVAPIASPSPWAATMQRKTVSMLRKKGPALSLKPAMKYTTRRKRTGSNRSSGRSLVVLATKYALSLYMSAALSLLSTARS